MFTRAIVFFLALAAFANAAPSPGMSYSLLTIFSRSRQSQLSSNPPTNDNPPTHPRPDWGTTTSYILSVISPTHVGYSYQQTHHFPGPKFIKLPSERAIVNPDW